MHLHTLRSVKLNVDMVARLVRAFRLANLRAGMASWLQMKNANFRRSIKRWHATSLTANFLRGGTVKEYHVTIRHLQCVPRSSSAVHPYVETG